MKISLSRTLELARLAAKIGLKEARSGNLQSRIEQAALLAEELAQLKGAAMKAGQLLSLDLIDYFPKEAVEILSRLQNSATAEEFAKIEQILKLELGPKLFSQIESIDPIAIGTASIGQVHRAQYQNQDIVLKVQHAGVAESIDSDLSILKSLATTFCTLTGRNMDLGPLFNEFRFILEQEVDYLREAELQTQYRAQTKALPQTNNVEYVVPEVLSDLCTQRVLAMQWQNGVTLRKWMQINSSKTQREDIGNAILNLYFHEFFEWGLVQTDPNQANFLIREHGSYLELILLDFGATRKYERGFISNYVKLLELTSRNDRKSLAEHAIAFGLIDSRESPEAFEAFFDVLTVAVRPFFQTRSSAAKPIPFDFTDEKHLKNSQETSKTLSAKLKFSPPPRDLVFLHRKLAGVYAILKALKVQLDVSAYWQRMTEKT